MQQVKIDAGKAIHPHLKMGHFMDARGCLCPIETFHAKIGVGGVSLSGNGTFHGRNGLFTPQGGVSCQNRCRQGVFIRKLDVS